MYGAVRRAANEIRRVLVSSTVDVPVTVCTRLMTSFASPGVSVPIPAAPLSATAGRLIEQPPTGRTPVGTSVQVTGILAAGRLAPICSIEAWSETPAATAEV